MNRTQSMTGYIQSHRQMLFAVLCAGTSLSLVLFRMTSFADWFGVRAAWSMVDFRTAIYYPVAAFLAGENPYNVEAYLAKYPAIVALPLFLPVSLVLHTPFGLLPVGTSSAVYLITTFLLTFTLAYVSLIFTDQKVKLRDVLLIGGLLLFTRAGHWNALVGQLTLQFVLATYVALHFAKSSPVLSGLGLAISLIKPTFGIPIALLMLCQGHGRPVVYGGIITILLNLPLLLLLAQRESGIDSFVSLLTHNYAQWQNRVHNNPVLSIIRIDAVAFIARLLGKPIGFIAEFAIFASILAVAGWTLWRNRHINGERNWTLSVGVVALATLLCTYHQAYDLLLLTLPFVSLVRRGFPEAFYSSYRYHLSLALLTVLALNYAATESIMRFVQQGSALWLFVVSINSVAMLTLFFLWIQALTRLRSTASATG